MDIITFLAFLLLIGGTLGAWVYAVWWSRRPKRPARSWTLNWNMAGVALLALAVILATVGALWSQPQVANSFGLPDEAARAMDAARACLLVPGVILGVLGLASLVIARRPADRRFTPRELVAAAIFLFGLLLTGEGVAYVTSRAILPPELSANSALDRLLPGIVIMLAGVGVWYAAWPESRKEQAEEQPAAAEMPPPWNIATAVSMIVGYFAVMYIVGMIVATIAIVFVPEQGQDALAQITGSGVFLGVTNGLGDLVALVAVYGIIRSLARGKGDTFSLLGLRRFSSDWIGIAAMGVALLVVLFELGVLWFKVLPVPKFYLKMFSSPADWTIMILFLLLLAPLTEEVVHRGVFYPAVAGRYGVWTGVIASSLVFGGMYVITYASDWAALVRAFAMGVLYTLLRAGSKSIWPGVFAFTLMDVYLIAKTMMLLR